MQTTTESLAKQLRNYNPDVSIFENCLEQLPLINPEKWEEIERNKRFRLFFGALNREQDWASWIEPLNETLERYPEKVEVDVIHDQKFFDCLKTPYKRFTPTCNYSTYLDILKNSHISLLPLRNTSSNKQKSDLKFVESAGCGVAVLASPTVYANTINDTELGNLSRWQGMAETLSSWINNPNQAESIASAARQWCQTNRLQSSQSQKRLDWYSALWERRDELTTALIKRVPELAI